MCRHGRPTACQARHVEDDPALGQPLCPDCYDYASQVIWQWWNPNLWRRFTITLRRRVAKRLGVPVAGARVDPVIVQAWLGHASIATTNIYLHHLGSSADRAGLDRLNALGVRARPVGRSHKNGRTPPGRRFRWWDGVLGWWS